LTVEEPVNKTRAAILFVLGTLMVVVVFGLGYALLTGSNRLVSPPTMSQLGSPHRSPKAVARAWIEAVDAGNCNEAENYVSHDGTGFMCGGEGTERMISAGIDVIDVDSGGPFEYSVKVYGNFALLLRPVSGSREEMDRLHRVDLEIIRLYVEEIDGRYYVSPFSRLLFDMLKPAL
jgi:hypothetical protein